MKTWVLMILLFIPLSYAKVAYKGIDNQGQVSYSDLPIPNSQTVPLVPTPSYSTPVSSFTTQTPTSAQASATDYAVTIVHPYAEQTFSTAERRVAVLVQVEPALLNPNQIQLFLNKRLVGSQHSNTFNLVNLPRGSYLLEAVVVSGSNIIAKSAPVRFYQQRATVFH